MDSRTHRVCQPDSPTGSSRRHFMRLLGAGAAAPFLSSCGSDERRSPLVEDPAFASAVDLASAIRAREISSEEVVRACLRRIEEVNSRINAVVLLTADAALAEAREADQALAGGKLKGPLHGVPMTLKDSLDTAEIVSTGGTSGRAGFVPEEDATVVARLKAAGAILLGKTNTPELTLSFETDNRVYGRTNNPYDLTRTSGGSSGGAAAIVAAGGAAFDIGSDTGGSIRLPCHFCGTAGIKPTSGRVPRTGHIISYGGIHDGLTQLGPIARYVRDLGLILRIIAGPDGRDPSIVPMPLMAPGRVSLSRLRAAWHTDNGLFSPTAEIAGVVRQAAAALSERGLEIEAEVPPPVPALKGRLDEIDNWIPDGGAWVRRLLRQAGTEEHHPLLDASVDEEQEISTAELTKRLQRIDEFRSQMLSFMENYDVIVCPGNALTAIPHGTSRQRDVAPAFIYTWLYNIVGWPGAVVRCGTSSEGLPIGVQVLARPWREDVAVAVAGYLESVMGGYQRPTI